MRSPAAHHQARHGILTLQGVTCSPGLLLIGDVMTEDATTIEREDEGLRVTIHATETLVDSAGSQVDWAEDDGLDSCGAHVEERLAAALVSGAISHGLARLAARMTVTSHDFTHQQFPEGVSVRARRPDEFGDTKLTVFHVDHVEFARVDLAAFGEPVLDCRHQLTGDAVVSR